MAGVLTIEKESVLNRMQSLVESNSDLERDKMKLVEEKAYLMEDIKRLERVMKGR